MVEASLSPPPVDIEPRRGSKTPASFSSAHVLATLGPKVAAHPPVRRAWLARLFTGAGHRHLVGATAASNGIPWKALLVLLAVSSDRPAPSNHPRPHGDLMASLPTASLARLSRRHLFLDLEGGLTG
ncbi:hypothetical protein J3F84DRAFT_379600 [Trichoderma pleuroticola]